MSEARRRRRRSRRSGEKRVPHPQLFGGRPPGYAPPYCRVWLPSIAPIRQPSHLPHSSTTQPRHWMIYGITFTSTHPNWTVQASLGFFPTLPLAIFCTSQLPRPRALLLWPNSSRKLANDSSTLGGQRASSATMAGLRALCKPELVMGSALFTLFPLSFSSPSGSRLDTSYSTRAGRAGF
jgi:hypothetical protein